MARVTLRLPDELHRRLVAAARRSGGSLNQTIVDRLNGALVLHESGIRYETPLQQERRLVREALGDLVVDFEPEDYGALYHPLPDEFDREAFFRSLPTLDPPISRTVIDDREDRF